MVDVPWVPDRYDVIKLAKDPLGQGNEIDKNRLWIVLTRRNFNLRYKLATVIPLTTNLDAVDGKFLIMSWNFSGQKQSMALAYQVMTVDYRAREGSSTNLKVSANDMKPIFNYLKGHLGFL